MAGSRTADKGAGKYAREALSEWSKAARYGARAVAAKRRERLERPPLKDRLNPSKTDKGGRLGDVADFALSKFGTGGKVASKVSLGSRIVERIRGSDADGDSDAGRGASRGGSQSNASSTNGFAAGAPIPIQESIDVAVPVKTAFALCTRFE